MAIQLSKKEVISRDILRVIADARLQEAEALFQARHYASALYPAGYAVECYLKLAICITLDWEMLTATFNTHDLVGLLLYSGLDRKLRTTPAIADSFARSLTFGQWRQAMNRYGVTASDIRRRQNTMKRQLPDSYTMCETEKLESFHGCEAN
jgi:hypothetical protein